VRACYYGANPSESMLPFTVVACPSQEYANSLKAAQRVAAKGTRVDLAGRPGSSTLATES
jgi:hypothetical protein